MPCDYLLGSNGKKLDQGGKQIFVSSHADVDIYVFMTYNVYWSNVLS